MKHSERDFAFLQRSSVTESFTSETTISPGFTNQAGTTDYQGPRKYDTMVSLRFSVTTVFQRPDVNQRAKSKPIVSHRNKDTTDTTAFQGQNGTERFQPDTTIFQRADIVTSIVSQKLSPADERSEYQSTTDKVTNHAVQSGHNTTYFSGKLMSTEDVNTNDCQTTVSPDSEQTDATVSQYQTTISPDSEQTDATVSQYQTTISPDSEQTDATVSQYQTTISPDSEQTDATVSQYQTTISPDSEQTDATVSQYPTTLSPDSEQTDANVSDNKTTLSPESADETKASNPSPTVSRELYERIIGVYRHVFFYSEIVSVLLTSTSASIYALPNMRCATACYLVALNAVDTLSGLLGIVRGAWLQADQGASFLAEYHYLTIVGTIFISVACRRMVYCFSLLLSAERLFVIAFPLKARYMKIIRYPKLCIAVLVVTILAYHVYLPLQYRVVRSPEGQGHVLTFSEAYRSQREVFDDVSNAAKCLFAYIPLLLCLGLCVALRVALRRHAITRRSLRVNRQASDDSAKKVTSSNMAERQLASTIWVSTLLFTLLSLPSNTVQAVSSYHPTFRFQGFEHRLYTLVSRFASLAVVCTRYTNFLAYLCLSTAFRRNLLRMLRLPCRCGKKVVRRFSRKEAKMTMAQTSFSFISGSVSFPVATVPGPASVDV
ncbi:uncharacterized protein [Littorina saxatilis]|uniref:uncharacterized protein n=1 Tax=Littorina saxatilis TaxID=31220 RepID=UPI0038B62B69